MSSSADEISRVGAADAASDLAAVQPEGFFKNSLREGDAAVADAVAAELDLGQDPDRADRVREHRLARGARGAGARC